MAQAAALVWLLAYLAALGYVVRRWGGLREQSMAEFAVASRSFPWYMIMFTVLATWFVGSVYTGWVGMAATAGTLAFYGTVYTLGGFVVYYILAPKMWAWGKAYDLYNLPDFIELRYGSRRLATFVALAALIIGAPWQVMAMRNFGYIVYSMTEGAVPVSLGTLLMVAFVWGYITWGGQRSVVVTDFVQGLISVVIVIFGIVYALQKLFGGIGPLFARLMAEKPDILTVASAPMWSSWILVGIIGSYCWLEVLNRIFLARSVEDLRIVAAGAPILGSLMYFLLMILGLGGALLPEVAKDQTSAESGFFTMFKMAGGPWLLAFAGVVVLAAEMSSVDSQMNAAGVVLARNVLTTRGREDEARTLRLSRWIIGLWMLAATLLSMLELPWLVQIAVWTYEFIVHLFPVTVLGALWRRGTAPAAVAGMVAGMAVTAALQLQPGWTEALGGWGPGVVGFAVNLAIYLVGSLLRPADPRVEELFAGVGRQLAQRG